MSPKPRDDLEVEVVKHPRLVEFTPIDLIQTILESPKIWIKKTQDVKVPYDAEKQSDIVLYSLYPAKHCQEHYLLF